MQKWEQYKLEMQSGQDFIYLSLCISMYNVYICLSFYLYICAIILHLSIYLTIYSSIRLSIHLSDYLSFYLSIYLTTYLSIWLSIHISGYLALCINLTGYLTFYLSSDVYEEYVGADASTGLMNLVTKQEYNDASDYPDREIIKVRIYIEYNPK